MTIARLLLEIRRLAAGAPQDVPRATAMEQAARAALAALPPEPQRNRPREIVAALLGIGEGRDFDASVLDSLTPEAILRLDILASDFMEPTHKDAMSALHAALIRPSHH